MCGEWGATPLPFKLPASSTAMPSPASTASSSALASSSPCYNIYLPCAFCAHVLQQQQQRRLIATCSSTARRRPGHAHCGSSLSACLPATWHILNTFHALLNSLVVAQVPQGYLLLENMFTRVVHILIVCFADIVKCICVCEVVSVSGCVCVFCCLFNLRLS